MNRSTHANLRRIGPLFILAALLALAGIVYAQTGGHYDLSWWTVDNGGATFNQSDGYSLGGSIGQPDAGALNGGHYTLSGGFWVGSRPSVPPEYHIYLPLTMRNT